MIQTYYLHFVYMDIDLPFHQLFIHLSCLVENIIYCIGLCIIIIFSIILFNFLFSVSSEYKWNTWIFYRLTYYIRDLNFIIKLIIIYILCKINYSRFIYMYFFFLFTNMYSIKKKKKILNCA